VFHRIIGKNKLGGMFVEKQISKKYYRAVMKMGQASGRHLKIVK